MKVQSLTLRNFRNIHESTFTPGPQLNFLVGQNGQGKTSILEALGFVATLRSFRGAKSPEVIRWGADSAEVACRITTDEQGLSGSDALVTDLKVTFAYLDPLHHRATKVASINGKPFKSSTQYLSQRFGSFELGFHCVIFNPSDHDLVRGDPATRRSYLDRVLAAEDVDYLKTLQKYARVLEQRNAVLKNSERPDSTLLSGFTEPLARYSALLTLKRLEWIQRLAQPLNEAVHHIAPAQADLRLVYLSNWVPPIAGFSYENSNLTSVHFTGHGPLPSLELLEQAFWNRQSTLEAAEWKSRHSLVGCHRDDWAFFFGSQPLKGHGSQGEVRSALLALKLSELALFQTQTGHRPLFLLDDFSSELDRDRRAFLLNFLHEKDLQVFVSTTDESFRAGKQFWVVNGEVRTRELERL